MTCARAAPDFSMAGCAQRPACGPAVTFDIAHAALVLSRHLARPCKCAASSCSVRRQLQLGARFEVLDVPCRYLAGGTIRGGQQVCNQACRPCNGDSVHRESVSGLAGFSLGVLITSCTANLNVH